MKIKMQHTYERIVSELEEKDKYRVSTCNFTGWDIDEHIVMPFVAEKLMANGYMVIKSINHGVTDWDIFNI